MKASAKRFSSILLAIVLFVASLLVYSSFIRPAYSEIAKLRTERANRVDIIDTNKESVQQVQKLLGEYQDSAGVQETTSLILPLQQNVSQGIDQINGLARVNNLTVNSLSVQQMAIKPSSQPKMVKGVGTLRFTVHLAGNYGNLKSFLQMMETNIYMMNLVDLKMESALKSGANVFLYTINIDAYYQS